MPPGVRWPRLSAALNVGAHELGSSNVPLPFLLQLNLAQLAPFDVAKVLPARGLLWFFFRQDQHSDSDDSYILHRKRAPARLERCPFPKDLSEAHCYRPLEVDPKLEWTIPSPADSGLEEDVFNEHLGFWDGLGERVANAQGLGSPSAVGSCHRLLGHPDLIQSPGLADGTKLLLQVDSDAPPFAGEEHLRCGMTWGDCGRIFYLIKEQKLKAHDFANPWALLEMA